MLYIGKSTYGYLVATVLAVLIFSCNETKDVTVNTLGYDYYPIIAGTYRIYDVEEIKYRVSGFDTSAYQLRETIVDSIFSGNEITYLLRRDIRADETKDWLSDSVWTVRRTSSYLSITENNVPFLKLTFPVISDREWDGNSLNSSPEKIYLYAALDQAVIDSVEVEDHIRVVIEDIAENVTGQDMRSEVYVKGIGLVEKDYLTLVNCTASSCGEDLGKVIGGRSLKQTLIEIGNE